MGPMWKFLIRNWKTLLLGAVLPMAGVMLWAGITTALGYSGILPLTAIFSLLAPPLATGVLIVLAAATVIDLSMGAASLVMASSRSAYQYMTGTRLEHDSDNDWDDDFDDFTAGNGKNPSSITPPQPNRASSRSAYPYITPARSEDGSNDNESDDDTSESSHIIRRLKKLRMGDDYFTAQRGRNQSGAFQDDSDSDSDSEQKRSVMLNKIHGNGKQSSGLFRSTPTSAMRPINEYHQTSLGSTTR
jgi:hypothetical protein